MAVCHGSAVNFLVSVIISTRLMNITNYYIKNLMLQLPVITGVRAFVFGVEAEIRI